MDIRHTIQKFGLRGGLASLAGLDAALLLASPLIYPTALAASGSSTLGLAGGLLMVLVYGMLAWFGSSRLHRWDPSVRRLAAGLGLAVGAVFTVEIALEYILLPADNTTYGTLEFGLVFLLIFVGGVVGGLITRQVRGGLLAALGTALLGSLVWVAALLIFTYLFKGTPQQAQVLQAEGTYFDFQRSGMQDFQAFVIGDYYGATFYHLLLGLVFSSSLGTVGGVVGKILVVAAARRHPNN